MPSVIGTRQRLAAALGKNRSFIVRVPASYDGKKPLALIFAFLILFVLRQWNELPDFLDFWAVSFANQHAAPLVSEVNHSASRTLTTNQPWPPGRRPNFVLSSGDVSGTVTLTPVANSWVANDTATAEIVPNAGHSSTVEQPHVLTRLIREHITG